MPAADAGTDVGGGIRVLVVPASDKSTKYTHEAIEAHYEGTATPSLRWVDETELFMVRRAPHGAWLALDWRLIGAVFGAVPRLALDCRCRRLMWAWLTWLCPLSAPHHLGAPAAKLASRWLAGRALALSWLSPHARDIRDR